MLVNNYKTKINQMGAKMRIKSNMKLTNASKDKKKLISVPKKG